MNNTIPTTRHVIFHYHFFKNAGTSIDLLLKKFFKDRWVTREFGGGEYSVHIARVAKWIEQEKNAVAFSSHTAQLPPPKLDGIEFLPIVFVRHPIDRIASAYAFERKQITDNGFGPTLARNTNLAGYIDVQLAFKHSSQCRDFHTARLAAMFKDEAGDETALALRAIDTLPFVGSVELFDQSVKLLCDWLAPYFPDFHASPIAVNVSRDHTLPLEQKINAIRAEIGDACYARLVEANQGDLAVFEAVKRRYEDLTQ